MDGGREKLEKRGLPENQRWWIKSFTFTSVFHNLFITLSLHWKTSCYPDSGKQPVNICAANHEILTNLTFISHGWWILLFPLPRHHLNNLVIEPHTSVSPSKVAHWNLITLFQGAVSVTRVAGQSNFTRYGCYSEVVFIRFTPVRTNQ